MKIIVAIDSFKGCLTSVEANQAASEGILAKMPDAEVVQVPVSDGGEGFIEAFQAAMGGQLVEVNVKDPIDAAFARRAQSDGGYELWHGPVGGGCRKKRSQAYYRGAWW